MNFDHMPDEDGYCICTDCELRSTPCVYFIKPEGADVVKIGATINLHARLSTIQVGHHLPLHVAAYYPAESKQEAFQRESILHDTYASLRRRGEWFTLSGDLADYVEELSELRGGEEACPCPACTELRNPPFDGGPCMMCLSIIGADVSHIPSVCADCLDRLEMSAAYDPQVAAAYEALLNTYADPIDSDG